MSAAMILRLPPAVRVALAVKSFAQSAGGLTHSSRLGTAVLVRCTDRRKYATVHVEDTDRLWTQHGKDAPSVSSSAGDRGPEGATNSPKFSLEATSEQSLESKEIDNLLQKIRDRLKQRPSGKRTRLKNLRKQALDSPNRLLALKDVARRLNISVPSASAGKSWANSESAESVEHDTETPVAIELLDFDHFLATKPLPTKKEYPLADASLFNPSLAVGALHNISQMTGTSIQIEVDFSLKQGLSKESLQKLAPGLQGVHVCTLKVEIPDIFEDTAIGEGLNKQAAKKAASLYLVSKMHVAGVFKELFPETSGSKTQPVTRIEEPVAAQELESPVEAAEIDEQTMEAEADAKAEIYNYAASVGLVPHFETTVVQPRTPRTRLGRVPKKPKALLQVRIQLDAQGIDVTATGKDLKTAEVAASVAFKEQAEKQYSNTDREVSSPARPGCSVLTVDTAVRFFAFYKIRESGLNIEIEHDLVDLKIDSRQNSARISVNGNPIGQTAIMRTKKQAESVAYLTAAVEIAKDNPQLLYEFQQTLMKGKGKVLQPLRSTDLLVESATLQSMRDALVEARDAGLADSRSALDAEVSDPGDARRDIYLSRRLSPQDRLAVNEKLLTAQRRFESDESLQELRLKKASLPVSNHRKDLLEMIGANQYSIVIGATGSGKTTQLPQILFEEAIQAGNGSACNIVCTQPRRIAATSVAQRVAVERNEPLRKNVGYHVRFDAKLPHGPFGISYCTTGILLEKLKHHPDEILDTTSHVIIDEVHERDLNIDFLMIILKRAIRQRQADGRPVPKVILMSATIDTDLFSNYFAQVDNNGNTVPCPSLSVPGRTFPVKEKYLGSIMYELLEKDPAHVKELIEGDPATKEYLGLETSFSMTENEANQRSRSDSVIDWKRERTPEPDEDSSARMEKEEALVPTALMATTIAHICSTSKDGAILAFTPGLEEIVQTQKLLQGRQIFGLDFHDESRFQLCILHSTVPKDQQDVVFKPSPPGARKIILPTNIAETSVTVPEVRYVVDSGKLREKRYDQLRRITRLQCVWESKSNSKQRAGRAGRVQDGFYYALFSKERSESLRAVGLPELLRSDLQETCLSIKSQKFGEPISSFLAQAIEPPSRQAIEAAIRNLIAIEAFTDEENLTALGRVLSKLPVHPALGKMIILGIIFRCLDPMIILGALSEERSLFVSPLGLRNEATRAHRAYAGKSQSDHIALITAFNELRMIQNESNSAAVARRAGESFLHMGAFRTISQTAKQIEDILEESGLISSDHSRTSIFGPADLNRNSKNYELVKCLLLAGFHPNLASKTSSNGIVYRTPTEQSVLIHPSSLNGESKKVGGFRQEYQSLFAFSTLAKSNDGNTLFLRDTTRVTPLMGLLFGGSIRITGDRRLEIDDWLPFFVKHHDSQFATKLILEFRKALDRILNSAFSALSDLDQNGSGADLVSDPIREKFAGRVVEILSSSQRIRNVWPSSS